jgi:hypothetical protein
VLRLLLGVFLLAVALLLFKDAILRVVIEHRIRAETGMDVSIGRYSSGWLSPVVTIQDLKLYNTAEFGGTLFLNIPELHIELDGAALAKRQLHINLIRFNLGELDVVRNEAGQTNLFSIRKKFKTRLLKRALPRTFFGDFEFTGVDVLNVSLGKAKFIDLKEPNGTCENNLNLQNEIFKDVRTEDDLNGVLIVLYLRSGGSLCFIPKETMKSFLTDKLTNKSKKRRPGETPAAVPKSDVKSEP